MENSVLRPWVAKLSGKRVLVIGDVMADHYVWGKVERISPEAPIPVVHVSREEVKLGGAANVACNIAALGGRVTLAGVVGADSMGETLRSLLRDKGIDPSGLIKDHERPTIQKTRVMAQHQQVVRVDREMNTVLGPIASKSFEEACLKAMENCDAVLFSDYAKGALSLDLCRKVIAKAQLIGKIVAADPKPANIEFYRGATIVTPNLKEAQEIAGFPLDSDAAVESRGIVMRQTYDLENVLITRGEHGMSLISDDIDIDPVHIPTRAQRVFDVTGAGDTVVATLALAMAAGVPLPQACALANAAAGIVVGQVGVAVVTPAELEAALA